MFGFSICCSIYVMGFVVFNYSKMASWGFQTYSNTCWNIFGTSICFTKSGPFHPFFTTKALQEIRETVPKHLQNILLLHIPTLGKFIFNFFYNYRTSICWFLKSENDCNGSKTNGFSERFQQNWISRWWNLGKSWKLWMIFKHT